MSSPGTLRFGQVASTPSAPPAGYDLIYVKTDDVLYIQDSFGVEVALGSASAITSLSGEATGVGPGNAVVTLSNSAIIGKVLTGFVAGPNSPVLSTDTILQAFQKLQAQVSGTSGTAITALTGDVSATGPGSVPATVNTVGGKSAASIATSVSDTQAATNVNTPSTIVKRDASGNFSATTITANLTGNVSGSSASFTGSLSGDVTGTQSATVVSTVGGKSAASIATSVNDTQAATSTNTASTIVKRDASGNFSSNIITASLNGNANTATNSTNFTGSLSGDVTGTQSATVVAFVGTKSAADVQQSVSDTQAATSSNTASTIVKRDASGNFAANIISASLNGNANTATNATTAVNFTGSLSGDVTGTQSATAISASTVTGKLITGFVSAPGTVTASDSILTAIDKLDGNINASTASAITALTGDVSATGPGSVPATVNSVGTSSATNIHTAELAANAATSANTPSTIVKRDASGNFAATTITANLTGNVSGSAASFTGSLSGDVTGTQSATAISASTVTGKLLTGYTVGTNTPISATDSILSAFGKTQAQINATTGAAITALTGDVVATGPGSASATIQSNVVSNAKLAQMPANTLKGNNTGITANASDLTVSQVTSMVAGTPVTQLPDQANAAGVAGTLAKSDHIHNIPSGVPVQIGTSNIQGSAASFSLSDHVHSHGNQTVGTLHAAVTTSVNGFMSAADKVKLDAITGTNTGDVTLSAVGAVPNANAASITGQVLNLQPADASFPGVVTTGTQTIAGNKTFSGQTAVSNTSTTALTVNTTSMVVDATNNAIGIGVAPASTTFIDGVNSTGATKRLVLTGYGAGSTVGFRNRFARGTSGTPSAVQSGDILGFISGQGYGTSQFPAASTGAANFTAGENFTNTSNQTNFIIQTTPTGSVTVAESARITSAGSTLGPQTASTAIHKINGGLYKTVRTITTSLTIDTTTTDYYILSNHSGAINITLPAPVIGRVLVIKDISGAASTNNITLVRSGTEKIEGLAASRLLQTNWGSWTLTTDGTDWFIVS